jgi:transcriptional regulator with XRE-family HTH domain
MAAARWDNFRRPEYIERLRLTREALGYEQQRTFAEALGIPFKRWNSYERGYPIPRETAWLLEKTFGVSVEWLWWGKEGNMPKSLLKKIHSARVNSAELLEALEEERKARLRVDKLKAKKPS